MRRRGVMVSGMAFTGLLVGALGVVLAVSGQASSTRSLQAGAIQGRLAAELAESAIDECLAGLPKMLAARFPGDVRASFQSGSEGGLVSSSVLGTAWVFEPARTTALVRTESPGIQLTPVTVRPLYYNTLRNYGEIELSCGAMFKLLGARQLYRRVSTRHYLQLDGDGRTFHVNAVSTQVTVDRSREE